MVNNQNLVMPILVEDLGLQYATPTSKERKRYGIFQCRCGVHFKAISSNVKSGTTTSCGCYHKEVIRTHGLSNHRLYKFWQGIITRTTNPKADSFKNYGGRGIKVCERWKDVHNFIEDMEPTYMEGLSLDRKDSSKDYSPDNCRWTTRAVQSQNTRKLRSTNTSGFRGVRFKKSNNKWQAQISVNNKRHHLGYFDKAIDAAFRYDSYVLENGLEHTINGVVPE